MKHVVMFSSGANSWAAAKRVAERFGTDNLTLLFADTLIEDEDNYRFLYEAANNVGGELVIIADGRTPWEVFKDKRFIGNTRVDVCSRVLKRELLETWVNNNCDSKDTTIHLGIDITEQYRVNRVRERRPDWNYDLPLIWEPYLIRCEIFDWLEKEKLKRPRLYDLGFAHANCGGFCVKAGHGQFLNLLEKMPERFAFHEQKENEMREYLHRDIAILRDRRGGITTPLTLTKFRERFENNGADPDEFDVDDFGGCGCAID